MNTPDVEQAKISEALYHLSMALRCFLEATGNSESAARPVLFKIKDACRYIACRPHDLMKLRTLGELEPIETEWGLRWAKDDLDAYVDRCVVASEADEEAQVALNSAASL